MNREFVNIKLDREERPDLDEIYMAATQILTGQGGWPNSVFLTPELKPFYAGTYFPPEDRYGRPGFATVLRTSPRPGAPAGRTSRSRPRRWPGPWRASWRSARAPRPSRRAGACAAGRSTR